MSDRLLIALHGLPIEWPDVPEIRIVPEPARRMRWLPAIAAAAAVLVLGFVGPVRDAVADWLGVGVVRVVEVDSVPPDLGTTLDLGTEVPIGSVDLEWPDALGDPAAAFTRAGEASLVWAPSDELPRVGDSGVGAILTRFEGTLDPFVEKSIGAGTTLTVVTIDGSRAYWIEGEPHSFAYLDADGRPVPTTARLAANALIWPSDGFTFRFESALGLDDVVALFGG
jgi:hypothetical protein